jgi:hypothetical protein
MRGPGQNKEQYGFYDVTAWSLPLGFGLNAHWTEDTSNVAGTMVDQAYIDNARRGSVTDRAAIAYIIPYETDTTVALVMRLLQGDYKVSVASRQLNAGGRNWKPGTFVIRISRNPDSVHDVISRFSQEMGVNVAAVNSGYSDEGDTGVGGENVLALKKTRIAIAADEGVTQESYGGIWWTFDKYGIKFTPMTFATIRSGGLKDYNVLILPEGNPGRYMSQIGTGGVSTLKDFARSGGTIVTIAGASVWATLKDVGLTTSKMVGSEDDEQKGKVPEDKPSPTPSPAATATPLPDDRTPEVGLGLPPIASPSANNNTVPEPLAGAMFRATVDRTMYLNYGVDQNHISVLLQSGYFFRYSKEGTNAVVFDASPRTPLTVSGFVWEGNTERLLRGTSYIIDEATGGGHVVLFAEDPFYRGMTRSTTRQFFNAVAFNGVF